MNEYYALQDGTKINSNKPVEFVDQYSKLGNEGDIIDMKLGYRYTLYLKSNNKMYCVGLNHVNFYLSLTIF